jgi:DNA helicase-2/ATP-dependent DNA helicase PcrA
VGERKIQDEIAELKDKQARGREGKEYEKRARSIEQKQERILNLDSIKRFTYNPNGDNTERESLSHTEVIKMGPAFIIEKPLMGEILRARFPIILIDESQDTNRHLVEALLSVVNHHSTELVIGMFCDTMQRVYFDGFENLSKVIPESWEKPEKAMNHRSAKRIVELANAIRFKLDGKVQTPRSDSPIGTVHFFIAEGCSSKDAGEEDVLRRMAELSEDSEWKDKNRVKILILEHHMAARRLGFLEFFAPLYGIDSFKTGLIDGTLPELSFIKPLFELITALQSDDQWGVSKMIRKYSPLLRREFTADIDYDPLQRLLLVDGLVQELHSLITKNEEISSLEVLQFIKGAGLLPLHPSLISALQSDEEEETNEGALRKALEAPLNQMRQYDAYVSGSSPFSTQQGVKGLEFPRVMVIMDDEEARGFMFSYSKLFGTKAKTTIDLANDTEGKDTQISRTQRLFYVACTRAEMSLALVAYTNDIQKTKQTILQNNWFIESEITIM